jgi:surfactin family lipopeptide synthetase A
MTHNNLFDLDLDSFSQGVANTVAKPEKIDADAIAIVGMSCRMPGAENIDVFWDQISKGGVAVRDFPENRKKDIEGYLHRSGFDVSKQRFKKGAFLDRIDDFDTEFFGYPPREVELMDPHQRYFLQTAWQCLENAGYAGARIKGTNTGAFLGFSGGEEYKQLIIDSEPDMLSLSIPGNLPAIIASRLAYILDWNGANMIIDTSCSSSLVAIHMACQALRNGDCDMALAGSVKLNYFPLEMGTAGEMGIESSDGLTKTFDANSDGTGFGEGVICLLLKPLVRAMSDQDHVYAVVKGSSVNQDGASIGITAPNRQSQSSLLERTWRNAGINPEHIELIEAHGTATQLGDLTEIDAIKRAFASHTEKKQFCAIGSIKTNFGHLDTAAGIAGVLKSALALHHKQIPPSLNFRSPNPTINFVDSPVYVNEELAEWSDKEHKRYAGISSFGLSGTNCHVLLEQAPVLQPAASNDDSKLLVVSAKSRSALGRLIQAYIDFLQKSEQVNLDDLSYTACLGRWHHAHRAAFVFNDSQDLIQQLENAAAGELDSEAAPDGANSNELPVPSLDERPNETTWQAIAEHYVQGEDISWEQFFSWKVFRKVVLPVYQFEKKRYWLKTREITHAASSSIDDVFFQTHWEKAAPELTIQPNSENSLVFVADDSVAQNLAALHAPTTLVSFADGFEKSDDGFTVGTSEEDFDQLWLNLEDKTIDQIVYLGFVDPEIEISSKSVDQAVTSELFRYVNLVKSWLKNGAGKSLELIVYTHQANAIQNLDDCAVPQYAMIPALNKAIALEYPEISIRNIDINASEAFTIAPASLNSQGLGNDLALRNGDAYVRQIGRVKPETKETTPQLEKGDVVVVTGGTGGIGVEVALSIVEKYKVDIVLVGRKVLPAVEAWKEAEDPKLKQLSKLLDHGVKVRYYTADVADEKQLSKVWKSVLDEFGKIDGIIHAAGVAGDGFLIRKPYAVFEEVLAAKVNGTMNLHELTRENPVKCFLLFSSITSLLGAIGQSDYTAANAFLDAFASYRESNNLPVQVVNWSGWKEVGMLKDHGVEEETFFDLLPTKLGLEALHIVLENGKSNVIIGQLDPRFGQQLLQEENVGLRPDAALELEINSIASRVELTQEQNNALNTSDYLETEAVLELLTSIWKDILGYEEIDPSLSFFDVGGDSLKLTKVHYKLNVYFPGEIMIGDLFRFESLNSMSEFIASVFSESKTEETVAPAYIQGDTVALVNEILDRVESGELTTTVAAKSIVNYA